MLLKLYEEYLDTSFLGDRRTVEAYSSQFSYHAFGPLESSNSGMLQAEVHVTDERVHAWSGLICSVYAKLWCLDL